MAEYYTAFSCILDVRTRENAARALVLYNEVSTEPDNEWQTDKGFDLEIDDDAGGTRLWISAIEYGEPEQVIAFVRLCAEMFDLKGLWGFQWANFCSRLPLDGFSGGAHVLDLATGDTVAWADTDIWLADQLADQQ